MEMENKYYIPTPEDFRIGFEFECRPLVFGVNENEYADRYVVKIIQYGGEIDNIKIRQNGRGDVVRVSYLTKEQIEAEGWIGYEEQYSIFLVFEKRIGDDEVLSLVYGFNAHTLHIEKLTTDGGSEIFNGKCRCINDFRLICKMLEI